MTLANASGAGQRTSITKADPSTNTVTINVTNLKGAAGSLTLYWLDQGVEVISKADGSWWPVSDRKPKAALDLAYAATTDASLLATGTVNLARLPALPESQITGLVTDLAGKAPGTRLITAGTGLTGGGDLTADRTLTVAYGTTGTTAAVGNDTRILAGAAAAAGANLYLAANYR